VLSVSTSSRTWMRLCAAFIPVLFALASSAQTTASNGSNSQSAGKSNQKAVSPVTEEVTVTGTRTPIELERSPVSQAVVSRQEIESRDIQLIDKALELVPGVISERARGASDNDFGLGLRGFSGRGGQSRTLILLDDQPINNSFNGAVNWSLFSPADIQRVEIARGPSSSLYGGNAMGGVVNLISRRPDERHLEFFSQYGTRATDNFSLHLSDRFWERLGLLVSYNRYKTGGYSPQPSAGTLVTSGTATAVTGVMVSRTATGGTQYLTGWRGREWYKSDAFRARVEYTFTPRTFAYLQIMHLHRGDGYDRYASALRNGSGSVIDSGIVSFVDSSGVIRKLSISPQQFIGLPTGATTAYDHGQITTALTPHWTLRVTTGLNANPANWYVSPGSSATLSAGAGTTVKQFGQSIYGNLLATHTARWGTLLFGSETRSDRATTTTRNVTNWLSRDTATNVTVSAFGKTIDQSGYVQYEKNMGDRMNLVAGGRFDHWQTYDGGNKASAAASTLTYGDRQQNAVTGKVAVNYALPHDWHVHASVGNAFRGPSVYELYYNFILGSTKYVANPDEKPERLAAYEAGVQHTFLGRYSLEATGYTNRVKDLIYRTTDYTSDSTGATKILTNAGQSRTWGTELAFREKVLSWLSLQQSYTYTNSIILRNDALPSTVGKNLPYVPTHMLSYQVAAQPRRQISVNWSGRYVSSIYSTDTNTDTVHSVFGSYDLFFVSDGTLTYHATRHIDVLANADNLFNRSYYFYYRSPGRSVNTGLRLHF
jgi:iron complex outermembrane recepter protein